MIYRSKAPLRIGLAGGGTDVSPYCDLYGGAILNATISLSAYASIEPINENKIIALVDNLFSGLKQGKKIAKLKKADAEKKLMEMTERDIKNDLVEYVEKRKREANENADEIAKEIMAEAMERLATGTATERTISTVEIPSDDVKGKIIHLI